jgi:hypothetical protein
MFAVAVGAAVALLCAMVMVAPELNDRGKNR